MNTVNVVFVLDSKRLAAELAELGDDVIDKAENAALAKTAAKLRTRMVRDAANRLKLKVALVRRRLFMNAPTKDKLYAEIKVGSMAYDAIDFKALDNYPSGAVVRGMGRTDVHPHGFIRTGPRMGEQVWERVIQPWQRGEPREPQRSRLRKLKFLAPSEVFILDPTLTEEYQRFVEEDLEQQIDSQIARFLDA